MTHRSGPPPILTQDQIRKVVAWQERRQAFSKSYGTVGTLAIRFHVSKRALYSFVQAYERTGVIPGSGDGFKRRRALGIEAARHVCRWVDRQRQFAETNGSVATLAREFSVSPQLIYDCMRRNGQYRQVPRDAWSPAPSTVAKARRAVVTEASNDWRSKLLRSWKRVPP